jgi:hypothetical protein
VSAPAAEPGNVVDPMAMLKKSLEGKKMVVKHPPKTAAAAMKLHKKHAR